MRLFFRDTTQWSQLILLTVLVVVYVFNIKFLPLSGEGVTFFLVNVVPFVNLILAGFVLASIAARFIFPGVSLEGRTLWLLRSSPLSMEQLLWSKFWVGTCRCSCSRWRSCRDGRAAAGERFMMAVSLHDHADDLRDRRPGAGIRGALPEVQDRERGADPDVVRRPLVHDGIGAALIALVIMVRRRRPSYLLRSGIQSPAHEADRCRVVAWSSGGASSYRSSFSSFASPQPDIGIEGSRPDKAGRSAKPSHNPATVGFVCRTKPHPAYKTGGAPHHDHERDQRHRGHHQHEAAERRRDLRRVLGIELRKERTEPERQSRDANVIIVIVKTDTAIMKPLTSSSTSVDENEAEREHQQRGSCRPRTSTRAARASPAGSISAATACAPRDSPGEDEARRDRCEHEPARTRFTNGIMLARKNVTPSP